MSSEWAERWQQSWDRMQEAYIPSRELRLAALVDLVEAVVGVEPLVVDLACGTGSITLRLLDRLPRARVIAVDVDPLLLTIAAATFTNDERVRIVSADLREAEWIAQIGDERVDAVVTSTALHWLPEDAVRRLYGELADLIRPRGVFAHAEHMPIAELPALTKAMDDLQRERTAKQHADGALEWRAWWEMALSDPVLHDAAERRNDVFAGAYASAEFTPPGRWHTSALCDAGFEETGVVWRAGSGAIVAAVR